MWKLYINASSKEQVHDALARYQGRSRVIRVEPISCWRWKEVSGLELKL